MNGSVEFKKFIYAVIKSVGTSFVEENFEKEISEGVTTPIYIKKDADVLTVGKNHLVEGKTITDMVMKFRVKRNGTSFDLWPISFASIDGRSLSAETLFREKILVNAKVQNELIALADTWGKALAAQAFNRSLSAGL